MEDKIKDIKETVAFFKGMCVDMALYGSRAEKGSETYDSAMENIEHLTIGVEALELQLKSLQKVEQKHGF